MTQGGQSCSSAGDELLEYAYGELAGARLRHVEEHLARCPHCRAELERIAVTRRSMATLAAEPAPSAGLESLLTYAQAAAARARDEEPARRRRWLGPAFSLGGLLAAAAVVFSLERPHRTADLLPEPAQPASAELESPGVPDLKAEEPAANAFAAPVLAKESAPAASAVGGLKAKAAAESRPLPSKPMAAGAGGGGGGARAALRSASEPIDSLGSLARADKAPGEGSLSMAGGRLRGGEVEKVQAAAPPSSALAPGAAPAANAPAPKRALKAPPEQENAAADADERRQLKAAAPEPASAAKESGPWAREIASVRSGDQAFEAPGAPALRDRKAAQAHSERSPPVELERRRAVEEKRSTVRLEAKGDSAPAPPPRAAAAAEDRAPAPAAAAGEAYSAGTADPSAARGTGREPGVLLQLGREQISAGRAEDALATFAQFLERFPRHPRAPEAALARIQLLERLGRLREARAERQHLLQRYPGSAEARSQAARDTAPEAGEADSAARGN